MTLEEQQALLARGTVDIVPEGGLAARLEEAARAGRPLRVKLGLDPNLPDLHLGHSVVLWKLRQFQDLGHEVHLILGTFTAMIGDPTDRYEARRQQSAEAVRANARTYEAQYGRILDPARTHIHFNGDWLAPLSFPDVAGLCSKVTVARLLERDDFQKRVRENRPLHVHELMYPICQAYDSVHLKADIEMGGTDQRFNILLGRDLQREFGQEPQVAIFMPLLVGTDGQQKMSKSLGNTIDLDLPAYEMFSKILSISDAMMPDYYRFLTTFPMEQAEALIARDPLEAKKKLGEIVVTLYHGEGSGLAARHEWERVHAAHQLPDEIPTVTLPDDLLDSEGRVWIVRLLQAAGLVGGTNEGRRAIEQGGVQIDGMRHTDPAAEVPVRDGMVIQIGRRRFARVARPGG